MTAAPLDPLTLPLDATTLIEASAGTGKTFTLATLYLRLVVEKELEVGQILVVTYTNAATAELRDRLRCRLREALEAIHGGKVVDEELGRWLAGRPRGDRERDAALLGRALRDFDEAAIFTIHGFCQRVLQENAFESGVSFDAELMADETLLREDVIRDFWARKLTAAPAVLVRHLVRRKVTLAALARLAREVTLQPRMELLPAGADRVDLEAPLATWRRARACVIEIWRARRREVCDLLSKLSGTYYRVEWIESWALRMDGLLELEQVGLFPRFEKFTTRGVAEGARKGTRPPSDDFVPACDALLEADRELEKALDGAILALKLDLARHAPDELRRRKLAVDRQSFDDLLGCLDDALSGERGAVLAKQIRERYRAALVDEFQDTDRVQYEIFKRLYLEGGAPMLLIGDPKQAIYSFRGADVFTYLAARADVGGREVTLDTNRRSDPRLIAAVNAVFARVRAPFLFREIPFQPVRPAPGAKDRLGGSAAGRPPLEILVAPGDSISRDDADAMIPPAIAAEIARFLGSGATLDGSAIEPGDVAVLCRTNRQARDTQQALRELRVPSVLYGDSSVLDTEEALEVERVIAAMADPGDARVLRAALATTLVGTGAEELRDLQHDERRWDEMVGTFTTLCELWAGQGFVPAFRRLLDDLGIPARLLGLVDGERRLTNVLHLGELLQGAAAEAHRGPLALVEWLHRMRLDPGGRGDMAAEAMQIRLESDARAVKLTTIHQSKGLEYPIVYCPFLWGGRWKIGKDAPIRFHGRSESKRAMLDLGSSEEERGRHEGWAIEEELGENLRLLYVALTRARHRCTVVWGGFAGGDSSALGYVLHRPADLPATAALEEVTKAISERTKSASRLREEVERLAAASKGAIEVADLSLAPGQSYRSQRAAPRPLASRQAERSLADRFRISSFSRLAASGGAISQPAEEGVDHDEAAEDPETATTAALPVPEKPVTLHEFPRGARPGELVHAILEHLDFATPTGEALPRQVSSRLLEHGFEGRWQEPLCRAIEELLDAPLEGSLCLRRVPRERRLDEMEFLFPVAQAAGEKALLTGERLAAVLERHGAPVARPDYAGRVRRLGFQPLAGFLRGFVDLVFEHDGRWFVVDYKSNDLGPAPGDYRFPRLVEAMAHHHYFLQYLLYAVAVHRFLEARMPGYDYDQHFGGVYYLFLRGTSPVRPGNGVFHDRPSRALIEELSAVLDAPGRASRGSGAPR